MYILEMLFKEVQISKTTYANERLQEYKWGHVYFSLKMSYGCNGTMVAFVL